MGRQSPWRLGLDLGSSSIGWAAIGLTRTKGGQPNAIWEAGVRIFEAGVEGEASGGAGGGSVRGGGGRAADLVCDGSSKPCS